MIGGIDPKFMSHKSPIIFALSTWSWVQVGKFPIALDSVTSIVLPTGELVVIGGDTGGLSYSPRMFKAKLTGEDIACGYEASEDNVQLQYIRCLVAGIATASQVSLHVKKQGVIFVNCCFIILSPSTLLHFPSP